MKNCIPYFIFLLFLTCCNSTSQNKDNPKITDEQGVPEINLYVDGNNEGWHFVKIDVDSTVVINEKNNALYLNNNKNSGTMRFSDKKPFHFKVIDIKSNKDITEQMKIPSTTGDFKTYYLFSFYNPGKSIYPDEYFLIINDKSPFLDSLNKVKRKLMKN